MFMNTRRDFLRKVAVTMGTPAFLVSQSKADEEKLDMVREDEPAAAALGYKEDTKQVDKGKFPQHNPDQICANCMLAPVDREGEHIACAAFANRYVTKQGWCAAWAKKPA